MDTSGAAGEGDSSVLRTGRKRVRCG